jgi:hypothetical protein
VVGEAAEVVEAGAVAGEFAVQRSVVPLPQILGGSAPAQVTFRLRTSDEMPPQKNGFHCS